MVSIRHSLFPIALLSASLATLVMACGGKVIVDGGAVPGQGSGGAGSTTATTVGSSVTVGAGGAGGCAGLQADAITTLAAAQACKPQLGVPQCSGTNTSTDLCGCSVVANDGAVTAAQLANMAFGTWVNAGCGPVECLVCPPPPSSPWFCDPTTSLCKPAGVK